MTVIIHPLLLQRARTAAYCPLRAFGHGAYISSACFPAAVVGGRVLLRCQSGVLTGRVRSVFSWRWVLALLAVPSGCRATRRTTRVKVSQGSGPVVYLTSIE